MPTLMDTSAQLYVLQKGGHARTLTVFVRGVSEHGVVGIQAHHQIKILVGALLWLSPNSSSQNKFYSVRGPMHPYL